MSEESQAVENEGLLDESLNEVKAEEQEAKDANPEVIEDVLQAEPDEV